MNAVLATVVLASWSVPAWRLALNDSWSYRLDQTFAPMEGTSDEDKQRFSYSGSARVTAVKTGEFDLEFRTRLTGQRMGGERLPPGSPEESVAVQTFRKEGYRRYEWERYADEAEFRLSRLLWFVFPDGEDDGNWTATMPEVRVGWGVGVEVRYKRLGATERLHRKCLLYSVSFRELGGEHPMTASGRLEVDRATGVLMTSRMDAKNAPLPGAEERHSMQLNYETSALKSKLAP